MELLKSTSRLSWALTLLVVQHLEDSVRKYGPANWESSEPGQDPAFGLLPAHFTTRQLGEKMLHAMKYASGLLRKTLPSSEYSIALQELENKLNAFTLFEHVDLKLRIDLYRAPSLAESLQRTDLLEIYDRLWATEGLGYLYAGFHIVQGKPLELLLNQRETSRLSSSRMVPLHAGIGLAMSKSLLAATEAGQGKAVMMLDFVESCRDALLPEYREIGYEALGLTTHNLYPHLIAEAEQILAGIDPSLVDYFWHGAGRAIYFSPTSFLPGQSAPWQTYEICLQEPASGSGRRNAVTGFAWALTLVNIRHPEILSSFLRHHGSRLAEEKAFYNGVWAALIIWLGWAGEDFYFNAMMQFRPDADLDEFWDNLVVQACKDALDYYHTPSRQVAPGKLFRYLPFDRNSDRSASRFTQAPHKKIVHPDETSARRTL